MSGERRIEAPRETVWAALNDPATLKLAIPGCQEIEKLSDTEFTAKLKIKVGPVSAKLSGSVRLSDLDPPNSYTISGEGKGGPVGFAKGGAKVWLEENGGATVLRYEVNARVGGKLAQLGSRLIDATVKLMADDFFSGLANVLAGPAPEEAAHKSAATAETAAGGVRPLFGARHRSNNEE